MKKNILLILFFISLIVRGQVGLYEFEPKASLDVKGRPTDPTVADGITTPRLTLTELYNKGAYDTQQTSALIYVTDTSLTLAPGVTRPLSLEAIREVGFYFFDGVLWKTLEAKAGSVTFIGGTYWQNTVPPKPVTINGQQFFKISLENPPKLNIGGGVWNFSENSYQIPVTGNYLINLSFRGHDGLGTALRIYLSVNDTITEDSNGVWFNGSVQRTGYLYNKIVYLTKGTKIYPYFRTPTKTTNSLWQAFFNITLLNEDF